MIKLYVKSVFLDFGQKTGNSRFFLDFFDLKQFFKKITMDTNNIDEDLEIAHNTCDKKISNSSKKVYKSKIEQLTKYCQEKANSELDANGKLIVPLNPDVIKAFLGHKCKDKKSGSTIVGYKSAIKWFYSLSNEKFDENLDQECDDLITGHKRTISDMKQNGEMEVFEGKRHLDFTYYIKIIEFSIKTCLDFNLSIFSHLYIVLCWNLMSRTNNVSLLKYQHINWELDSMNITLPKHKGIKSVIIFS